MIRALSLVSLSLLAAVGCGGSSSRSTTPANHDAPAGDDQARLQTALAALATTDHCTNDPAGPTLGEQFAAQKAILADGGTAVDESFECQPPVDGERECTWSVFTHATGSADPCGSDDPCEGEGGSGYQIIIRVDAGGNLLPDSVVCVAPG